MADYSVRAVLSAVDKGFSSAMRSAEGSLSGLKSTLSGGIGFGLLTGAGQQAFSVLSNGFSSLTREAVSSSDSMQKLQQAMRFSGYSEAEIQRIAGATGSLKTYADKTVFSLQDVMSTFGSLSANGVKDADRLTESIGNAVAVFGGGAQEFSSVGLAFSQAMASGALHAQDWNQIINASPQLAGGLRKELIRLNPAIGDDFKGAMERGAISADMLSEAMNNIGMTDMAKSAATSVNTFEGAMGNLEASVSSGLMGIYDSFIKADVVGFINAMNGAVDSGFQWLTTVLAKAQPYLTVLEGAFKNMAGPVGEAVDAVKRSLDGLDGAFGSVDSIKGFKGVMDEVVSAVSSFAGFVRDHSEEVARFIDLLPKLVAGFVLMKVAIPVISGIVSVGKGIGGLIGKLTGVGKALPDAASKTSDAMTSMSAGAKNIAGVGAGIALAAAGFWLLANASIALADAGWPAIGVMAGMVVAMTAMMFVLSKFSGEAPGMLAVGAAIVLAAAGFWLLANASIALADAGWPAIAVMAGLVVVVALLAVGAAVLGPALTAGAIGLIAFGIAMALVGVAAVLAGAGLLLVSLALPAVVAYGLQGAGAIALLGVALIVFAVGAALAGVGCVVLAAGLILLGAGFVVAGVGAIVAAVGVSALALATVVLAAGLLVSAVAILAMAVALPLVAAGALLAAVGFAAMFVSATLLSVVLLALVVPMGLVAAAMVVASGVAAVFGAAMTTAFAGTLLLSTALAAVNDSMGRIANNARSAEMSIVGLVSAVDVVNAGLEALGGIAKSAVDQVVGAFSGAAGSANGAALKLMSGFNAGVSSGGVMAVAAAAGIAAGVNGALGSAADGAFSNGYQVGAGLASGMNASLGEVSAAADALVSEADRAIRAKAQIHSPSKLTKKLGVFLGSGMAGGIESSVELVKKAAMKLVSLPDASSVSLPSFSGGAGGRLGDGFVYQPEVYVQSEVVSNLDGRKVGFDTAAYVKAKNDFDAVRRSRIGGFVNV